MGQIIGYAFTDAAAASHTLIDDVVHSLVAAANRGDFSGFGKALAGFPLPMPVNFVVPTPRSRISPSIRRSAKFSSPIPPIYGNQITGFIVGQDKIDLTNFDFALNVRPAAITAPGPEGHFFLSNGVSYAAVINSGMLFLDVDGNGDFKGATDVSIQLVGTQGNPSGADLIF
jgi:hypothetical protein